MNDAAGAAFTIMPFCASQLMGSWLASGTVFPSRRAPAMLDYQPRSRRRTSDRTARRAAPSGISELDPTLRTIIARLLLTQLPYCPFCGSRSA
jgi:hypothetical protein